MEPHLAGKDRGSDPRRNSQNFDYDDLYVCDGSGAAANNYLGPLTVVVKLPDSAGTTTNFTPSTGANWQNVDDALQNADTDYNAETTIGELDLYNVAALGVTGVVKGVQLGLCVRSAGSGGETVSPMYRISAVNYTGTAVAVTTSYAYYLDPRAVSPATAVAWTTAEIDAAEFGLKLVS